MNIFKKPNKKQEPAKTVAKSGSSYIAHNRYNIINFDSTDEYSAWMASLTEFEVNHYLYQRTFSSVFDKYKNISVYFMDMPVIVGAIQPIDSFVCPYCVGERFSADRYRCPSCGAQ